MDGSYNQPYGHGHGSSHINSPQTPSSATYQTNVNRSKTRKWVEARQQTYDGDDWGNDDFEEEPDSPPNQQQPPVPANTRLASYGQRTPSTTVGPDPTNPPALHIPSQQAAPPAQVAHYPAGPSYPQEQPAAVDSSHLTGPGNFVSQQDSSDFQSSNAPLQQAPVTSFPTQQPTAPAYVDHTDHFGRVERKNTTRKPVGGAKPPTEGAAIDAPPVPEKPEEHISGSVQDEVPALQSAQQPEDPELSRAEDIDRHRLSTSPQLPDVARMSAFGVDLFGGNPRRVSAMAPPPTVEEAESPAPVTGTSVEPITGKADVSSLEQNSVPAEHLQTSAAPLAAAVNELEPVAPESVDRTEATPAALEKTDADVPSHMWRPSVPGEQFLSDEATAPASVAQPQDNDVSPISEHSPEANTVPNPEPSHVQQHKPSTLLPSTDEPTVAPLRTPSPHVSQIAPIATTSASDDSRADLEPLHTNPPTAAPTEPLEARVPEYSPSDYDPKSLQREATFSTVASSPLKESDILRDEIIKSLSPQHETAPANFPPPVAQEPAAQPTKSAPRDSTYTLSGYDSYWAEKDRGAQPTTSQQEGEPKAFETVLEEEPAMPTPKQTAALPVAASGSQTSTPGDADARRRFSWEMAGEEAAPAPAAPTQTEDKVLDPASQQTAPAAEAAIHAPESDVSPGVNVVVDAPQGEELQQAPESSAGVSHQVSQASSTRPTGQAQLVTPEPPSPVSDPSERVQAPPTEDRRPSLAEQKSLVRSEATPVAPSPPSGTHPALASSPTTSQAPGAQAPLMTFREIMGLSSAQERISKYDEARTRFATIESGLSDWIANLKASHPDHTNASASFGGSLITQGSDPSTIPSPVGGQAPPQQPYYQQYLNASSPTTASAPGRSRLGGLSSSGQSGSAFGHSSDKIGTKSKELMQTAGKMGKGLFSKGKSKLRGTGDKQANASPPTTPVQGKTKTDRRASWALSLGNRSRTEGMGLHSNAGQPAMGHSPQPSTTTGRLSTANTGHGTDHGSLRGPHSRSGPQGFDAQNQAANRAPATPDRAEQPGHSRDVSLPLTLDKDADESSWDPFNGTPYARRKSPAPGDALQSENNDHDTRVSGDWVVVPRENTAPRAPHAVAEDSGIGMSSQPDDRPSGLKRDASFGLPLIRRSTTLDFGLKDALGTDDQSDGRQAQQSNDNDRSLAGEDRTPGGAAVMQSSEPASQVQHPMTTSSGPSTSQNHQFPPTSPVRTQERSQAQASLPLLQTENPTQQAVTPPGPWKLEESYLSEPLHQVSRKRSGTDDSQQLTFGMDKEMGFTASSPISPPTMGPRQRSGNQLPPSSAQRYPELFTNTQPQNGPRGRSNSGSNMAGPGFPRTESNEFDIPGVGPPEERGRRKSSSIFKEFGNRLGRASSRDRRPSVSDSRPTTSEIVRPDGGSETNVWADNLPEKRKKRASLLNGLRSRPSMEIASQGNEMKPENGPTVIQSQGPGPSASQNALPLPSEEERKSKAGFGSDIMKLRSARTEKWDSNGPEEQHDQNAGKSRLSGFGGKVAGFAGAFRRPTMEQSNQSSASVAANDFNEEARRTSQQQAAAETQEGRGRRGSAAGMISGLLGRSSSRSRQQQQHPGQQPYGENGSNQPYAGRASMDQRPSVADTLARDPPPQATVRPVGHSPPPPEAPRKDSAATNDAGRFETVSPELSVRSGPQNVGEGPTGSGQVAPREPNTSMAQGSFGNMSRPPPVQSSSSNQANYGPPPQGYYAPQPQQQMPPQFQQQMHQPMHMQQVQSRPSFGPPKPQSTELLRQQSNQQNSLNIPGSRHSSISLSSSNQGRPQSGDGQQSSRWRGFKNRISAQLGPQGQDKGGEKEERSSSSKLFGALKRTSKQQSSPPVSMHQNASRSQQWAPPQQGMPQAGPQGHQQHMMAQGPPHMQQRMAPMQHQQQQQQQQQHFAQAQGQPQRPGMGPNPYDSYQRQPSSIGSQSFQQQQQQQQQQPVPQAQGPAPHMPGNRQLPPGQGPPGQHMQHERQYEQVPIPAAYSAGSGQGNVFNMDRQMRNYNTSFQYNNGAQPPVSEQRQQGSPQPGMYGQPNGQPNGSTALPKQVPAPSQSPNAFDNARFGGVQATSRPPPERINSIASAGQTSPQKTTVPPAASPPPTSVLPPPPSSIGRPDYVRGDSEVLPSKSGSITRKPTNPSVGGHPQGPRTPVTAAQPTVDEESKNPANLSVDVAKAEADKEEDIYDATPRVVQGKMGQKSPEPVAQSPTPPMKTETVTKAPPNINTGKKAPPAAGASFAAMELEDTEEARKRTIRLDSQEEKIYYDPADDDDNPTMSATSYPGQEWNPYGEFDYSDVGDEPQHESVRGR